MTALPADPLYLFAAFGLAAVVLLITFYPAFAAAGRRHPATFPITLVCLFFGWTLIGWLVALGWAYSDDSR